MLTPKQEKFCRCIVSGMDGKASYREAYDADNMKDNTVYNEANKLLMRDDITERIKEMSKPLENHAQNSLFSIRRERISFIQSRIELCKELGDENSIIRYTDMLNKIDNLYKDEVNTENKANPLENIDNNTLSKLISAG